MQYRIKQGRTEQSNVVQSSEKQSYTCPLYQWQIITWGRYCIQCCQTNVEQKSRNAEEQRKKFLNHLDRNMCVCSLHHLHSASARLYSLGYIPLHIPWPMQSVSSTISLQKDPDIGCNFKHIEDPKNFPLSFPISFSALFRIGFEKHWFRNMMEPRVILVKPVYAANAAEPYRRKTKITALSDSTIRTFPG